MRVFRAAWGGVAAAACLFVQGRDASTDAAPPSVPPAALRGTMSCTARACHGGLEPAPAAPDRRIQQNEATTWLTQDPHARAYAVLSGERARRIARNLRMANAQAEVRCLACHTNPLALTPALSSERQAGVGCESCHGAAAGWWDVHTAPDWPGYRDPSQRRGMVAIRLVGARVAQCVGCHVGAPATEHLPARDVNHDLIAAGHPRLDFEFAAFMANLPHHWKPRQTTDDESPRDWAVGQVASAAAAAKLLAGRTTAKSWPEFSEYDCFACHHQLGSAWRQTQKPRAIPWGSWYYALLPILAENPATNRSNETTSVLTPLRALRDHMAARVPDAGQAGRMAHDLSPRLHAWANDLAERRWSAEQTGEVMAALVRQGGDSAKDSWDGPTQAYLGLMALQPWPRDQQRSRTTGVAQSRVDLALGDLFRLLSMPTGPEALNEADSPASYAPDSVAARFRELGEELRRSR